MRLELSDANYTLTERIIRNKLPIVIVDSTYLTLKDENDEILYSVDTSDISRSDVVRKVRSLLELYV